MVNYLYPGPQTGSVGSRSFSPARRDHQALGIRRQGQQSGHLAGGRLVAIDPAKGTAKEAMDTVAREWEKIFEYAGYYKE